jgi:phosphopantothenoylcysteine decarboxylase/phosphopantothenate--cysteine ligase
MAKILLGITASIAAYKTPDLVRLIKGLNIDVKVVMTEAAKKFVTPLALEITSENPVYSDFFDQPLAHIDITKDIDALLIAPATANTLSKCSCGILDNLLTATFMTAKCPRLIAPAMNHRMYEDAIFQDRLHFLLDKGVIEIPPQVGILACGEHGIGRMATFDTIINSLLKAISLNDLKGKRILISAGPTKEPIDPVRFISNRSSGKMGFALAKAAYLRGADVTLVSGDTCLTPLSEVRYIKVQTANQMKQAMVEISKNVDIVIMAGAVADYRPLEFSDQKIPKTDTLTLKLVKNDDIINAITSGKNCPFMVGFSAQTGNRIDLARKKLAEKSMDMIVFNDISKEGAGFDCDTNVITIIDKTNEYPHSIMDKAEAANKILDKILENMKNTK